MGLVVYKVIGPGGVEVARGGAGTEHYKDRVHEVALMAAMKGFTSSATFKQLTKGRSEGSVQLKFSFEEQRSPGERL